MNTNRTQRSEESVYFIAEAVLNDAGFKYGPIFYWSRDHGRHSLQQELKFDAIEDNNLVPFGMSSFGYMSNYQFYNHPTIDAYCTKIETGHKPVWRGSFVPPEERMRREIMFGIRSSGVDTCHFERKYGVPLRHVFGQEFELLQRGVIALFPT